MRHHTVFPRRGRRSFGTDRCDVYIAAAAADTLAFNERVRITISDCSAEQEIDGHVTWPRNTAGTSRRNSLQIMQFPNCNGLKVAVPTRYFNGQSATNVHCVTTLDCELRSATCNTHARGIVGINGRSLHSTLAAYARMYTRRAEFFTPRRSARIPAARRVCVI